MVDGPVRLALAGGGALFLLAMAFGVWKFVAMSRSEAAEAPVYVDIAHRAALMYALSCPLIAAVAAMNRLPAGVRFVAVGLLLTSFAGALASYAAHGLLRDTDNQYRRPHRLGNRPLPRRLLSTLTWAKACSDLGGFGLLFLGFVARLAAR